VQCFDIDRGDRRLCLGFIADRTGLASMLYLQQFAGIDEETSERQLSARYGHIGIPYISAAFAMDESWEELEKVVFGLTS
jgi:protein tyrosine/serine phosphatase